jgi:hypothetical protein
MPMQVTSRGLEIDGAIQTFNWERQIQKRFARHAAQGAKSIVNVGYGLGFAHRAFELSGVRLYLIEANKLVLNRSNLMHSQATVYLGRWEERLPSLLTSASTIFFDAFPVSKTFSYSPQEFRLYIEPLLELLAGRQWDKAFFVAFDAAPICFRARRTLHVRRVLSAPIGNPKPSPRLARMSLYEAVKK